MFIVRLASPKFSKKRVIGMMQMSSWLCPKAVPFSASTPMIVKVCPFSLNLFSDGRFVREQALLDLLADDEHAARKRDIFIIDVSAVSEGIGVGGKETLVRSAQPSDWASSSRRCKPPDL